MACALIIVLLQSLSAGGTGRAHAAAFSPALGEVSAKPGLDSWTGLVDWTTDWTMDSILD